MIDRAGVKNPNFIHGQWLSAEYKAYTNMLQRCNNPNRISEYGVERWEVLIKRKKYPRFYAGSFTCLEDAVTMRDAVLPIRESGGVDIVVSYKEEENE